jgi:hypothetical protein
MKTHEIVQRCQAQLDKDTFQALMVTMQDLTKAHRTAVARCNHYYAGLEAMIDHECPEATFKCVQDSERPDTWHFHCTVCEARV